MASSLTKDSVTPGTPGSGKTFFGHPRGLATLFMTEMWERFSYYGMKALLTVYLLSGGPGAGKGSMGGGLAMDVATATVIVSVYSAMVYLLAMPGGWLGDRVWGPRKTVAIAAVTIMAGHLVLALPGGQAPFFAGLALVAVGSGLLKANISTMVGHLYDGPEDPRRDGGFTIFYMGINAGAFFAPLAIGTVGQEVNWHLGFGMAAVGMAIGLAAFLLGTRNLSPISSVVPKPLASEERAGLAAQGPDLGDRGGRLLRRRRLHRPLHPELGDDPAHRHRSDRAGGGAAAHQAGQGPLGAVISALVVPSTGGRPAAAGGTQRVAYDTSAACADPAVTPSSTPAPPSPARGSPRPLFSARGPV
ncbi:Dipeptide permease D [Streptomyces alboniger]